MSRSFGANQNRRFSLVKRLLRNFTRSRARLPTQAKWCGGQKCLEIWSRLTRRTQKLPDLTHFSQISFYTIHDRIMFYERTVIQSFDKKVLPRTKKYTIYSATNKATVGCKNEIIFYTIVERLQICPHFLIWGSTVEPISSSINSFYLDQAKKKDSN